MDPDHHQHSQEHGSSGYHHDVHDQWGASNTSPFQSHHQSPIHEYAAFNFSPMPIEPMYVTTASMPPPQQRITSHQQLQPLMVPPWPSQLTSHSAYPTTVYHHSSVSNTPITTPVSAPPTTGRHSERPRKTLTDDDRRRMCKYAEDHPNVKQTEIGAMFGVERSTVSKVLRNKEKYLKEAETKKEQKPKGKLPDIERALGSWVKNRQKAGQSITDAMIQDQLKHFSTTVGGPDSQPNATSTWLEKFKAKNGLLGGKSRKSSIVDDSDTVTGQESSTQQTPNISPTSPSQKRDHSPSRLSMALDEVVKEHKRVKSESPDEREASPISSITPQSHKPFASISSAFEQASTQQSSQQHYHSTSFSLSPIRPHSPFFPSNPFTQDQQLQAPSNGSNPFRPRSSTFPMSAAPVDSYVSPPPSGSDVAIGKFLPGPGSEAMDSPSSIMLTTSPVVPSRSTTSKPSSVIDPLSPNYGLPVSAVEAPTSLLQSASGPPSVQETQRALQVVWNFFQNQQTNLEPEEYVVMGKLMEKLKLHHQHTGALNDLSIPHGMHSAAYAMARSGPE